MKPKDILLVYGITAIVLWIVSFIAAKPIWLEMTWEQAPLIYKVFLIFIVFGIGCLWLRFLMFNTEKDKKSPNSQQSGC